MISLLCTVCENQAMRDVIFCELTLQYEMTGNIGEGPRSLTISIPCFRDDIMFRLYSGLMHRYPPPL